MSTCRSLRVGVMGIAMSIATAASAAPAEPGLAVTPMLVDVGAIEVDGAIAGTSVQLTNISSAVLVIQSLQITDAGTGAAADWTVTPSGACSEFPDCMLGATEQVDLTVELDPSVISARDAMLIVNYHDTIDRSVAVPLRGLGRGGTLDLVGGRLTLDLGTVPVSLTSTVIVELANAGNRNVTAALSIEAPAAPFSLTPPTAAVVPPGPPTTIDVSCRPTTPGPFSTTIHASASDAIASPPIAITVLCEGTTSPLHGSPTAIQLGEVRIEDGVVTRTVALLAAGSPLALESAGLETDSPDLAVSSPSSPATPSMLQLVVTPTTEGDLSPTSIVVTPASGPPLRIPVTGRIVDARYAVPETVSLGSFCVTQSTTTNPVRLTSTGTATIAMGAPVLARGATSPFELAFTTPTDYTPTARLTPGAVASIAVTPRPQLLAGLETDDVVWTTDVAAQPTAVTAVSAMFIDHGAAAAPSNLGFGKVPVHLVTRNAQTVTLQNCETTAIVLDPPMLAKPFEIESPTFPELLMPGEAATLSIGFHPTKLGVYEQVLAITSPQLDAPLRITLAGQGVTGGGGGGDPDEDPDGTSFYACGCTSNQPSGVLAIGFALGVVLRSRRRHRATGPNRTGSS